MFNQKTIANILMIIMGLGIIGLGSAANYETSGNIFWGYGFFVQIFGVGFIYLAIFLKRRDNWTRHVLNQGQKYPAKILSISEVHDIRDTTQGKIENLFKIEFEWNPPGSPRTLINTGRVSLNISARLPKVGDTLYVFADPENIEQFELDTEKSFPSPSLPRQEEEKFSEAVDYERIPLEEYEPHRWPRLHGWTSIVLGLFLVGTGAYGVSLILEMMETDQKTVYSALKFPFWTGVIFVFAGLPLLWRGIYGVPRKGRFERNKRKSPNQPWLWEFPWNPEGISDSKGKEVLQRFEAIFAIGLFLALISWGAFIVPGIENKQAKGISIVTFFKGGEYIFQAIVILFDLMFIWVAGFMIFEMFRYFKYGNKRLRFSGFPFFLGDSLGLTLEGLPNKINHLQFNLRHIEEAQVRMGKTGAGIPFCYELYRETRQFEGEAVQSPGRFSMQWTLPEDKELTTFIRERPVRYWELEVKADTPGIDYHGRFLLPIYAKP